MTDDSSFAEMERRSKLGIVGIPEMLERPLILLAHGASAGSASPFMQEWKQLLADSTNAIAVISFDYPFPPKGRGHTPKATSMVHFHMQQLAAAMAAYPGHPVILCGKSFGSRVSGLLASREDCPAKAVVCLTYPIKGANGSIRDQILLDLKRPVMLVQGTEDLLGPLDLFYKVRPEMKVPSQLYLVEGANHFLVVPPKRLQELGTTQREVNVAAARAVAAFIASVL